MKNIDQKCYNFAAEALRHVKQATDEDRTELGEAIKETIQEFISNYHETEEES